MYQHYMHKSEIVREKLRAKDSTLGSLLIESAMEKSDNAQTHILYTISESDNPLHSDDKYRDTGDTDLAPRATNGVRESDIVDELDPESFLLGTPHASDRILKDSRQLLIDDNSLIDNVMRSNKCSEVLKPYRLVVHVSV